MHVCVMAAHKTCSWAVFSAQRLAIRAAPHATRATATRAPLRCARAPLAGSPRHVSAKLSTSPCTPCMCPRLRSRLAPLVQHWASPFQGRTRSRHAHPPHSCNCFHTLHAVLPRQAVVVAVFWRTHAHTHTHTCALLLTHCCWPPTLPPAAC